MTRDTEGKPLTGSEVRKRTQWARKEFKGYEHQGIPVSAVCRQIDDAAAGWNEGSAMACAFLAGVFAVCIGESPKWWVLGGYLAYAALVCFQLLWQWKKG
jgi:hypothetical protein